MAGNIQGSKIVLKNCYAIGTVTGNEYCGGVVGYNYAATVENCYAAVAVTATRYSGGLVGNNGSGATTRNCAALVPRLTRSSGSQTSFRRVAGTGNGTLDGNYARSDMTFLDSPTSSPFSPNTAITSDPAGVHGADITSTDWGDPSWWQTGSNWSGGGSWSSTDWDFTLVDATHLPRLKGMPGGLGIQNPQP